MPIRDIYLKIDGIVDYSPVEPDDHMSPRIHYRRDSMRNPGHKDGTIPADEVAARQLTALSYRENLDPQYQVLNWLRIHVRNADVAPPQLPRIRTTLWIDSD